LIPMVFHASASSPSHLQLTLSYLPLVSIRHLPPAILFSPFSLISIIMLLLL
jgi:hypothetical protein